MRNAPNARAMSCGRAVIAGVPVAATLAATGSRLPVASGAAACAVPHGARVLATRDGAVVYVVFRYGEYFTELCDRGTVTDLDGGDVRVQLSSVDITATDYGLAARDCTADVDEILPVDPHCMTVVVAESRATHERTAIYDPTLAETQVSRLRVGDYGAVAWIDCSAAARGLLGPDPRLTRSCRHSNKRTRHVYVAMPDQTEPQPSQPAVHSPKPVLLDHGHDIAPFSLSITDTCVIWRQRNPGS